MEIWAHALVKNEARWLWYSVNSVIDNVDKLLLWDTGSTDETIEVEQELVKKYPSKINFKKRQQTSLEDFTIIRQEMLDATASDWFLVLDGDEIWWKESVRQLISEIKKADQGTESMVVPTINLVGDIFHYQDESAGKYQFGERVGHFNLRAVKRSIPGLHSQGVHGVWGWADNDNKMIQDRKSFKFIDAPYLHATFLGRGASQRSDKEVVKRPQKFKYEIGNSFPLDYFYPEAFFYPRPDSVKSPWKVMNKDYKIRAIAQTPLRKFKRNVWTGKPGY